MLSTQEQEQGNIIFLEVLANMMRKNWLTNLARIQTWDSQTPLRSEAEAPWKERTLREKRLFFFFFDTLSCGSVKESEKWTC